MIHTDRKEPTFALLCISFDLSLVSCLTFCIGSKNDLTTKKGVSKCQIACLKDLFFCKMQFFSHLSSSLYDDDSKIWLANLDIIDVFSYVNQMNELET